MKKKLTKNNPPSSLRQRLRQTKKGSVLVFALIVLSFILVTAFSLSAVSLIEKRSSGASVNSSTAFQNSDEGMEEFLQQLYKDLDQNDDLNKLAQGLGGGYSCTEPSSDSPARIGDQSTEFIITAYKEIPDTGGPGSTSGGWEDTTPITHCDEPLANVARFRATGNYNNASRAVFLKLRDSLTRGLVAHWSFEDRAQNARLADIAENKNSFMAGDSSKNGYTLTLCDVYDNDPADVSVKSVDENGTSKTYHLVSFDGCDNPNQNSGGAMDPFKYKDSSCSSGDGCTNDGAWREGIVNEEAGQTGGGVFGNDAKEALWFDGANDYLTALTDTSDCYNGSSSCDKTINYVDAESAKRLDLEDGIAISAWVKMSGATGDNVIVSKWYDDKGYQLSVDADNDNVCFKLNNKESCETYGTNINTDNWAHVVVTWRKSDEDMNIYINAGTPGGDTTLGNSVGIPSDVPLSIGARLDNANAISDYFKGTIDDIRIWNRALTEEEVCRLCWDAGQEAQTSVCDQSCKPTNP